MPAPHAAKSTDIVSVTAFVLSFSFCLSFVGVILGVFGIFRTAGGQRKGLWLAIAAEVIGIGGTYGLYVVGTIATDRAEEAVEQIQEEGQPESRAGKNEIHPSNARVGECASLADGTSTVRLTRRDCDEDHDAEVVYVGDISELGDVDLTALVPGNSTDALDPSKWDFSEPAVAREFCIGLMPKRDVKLVPSTYDYHLANANPYSADADAGLLCFVTPRNGKATRTALLGGVA